MKVRASVKPICPKCKVIKRKGVVRIICTQPASQAAAGLELMARIAGVDLPRNKRIEIALTYIYGLGRHAVERRAQARRASRPTRRATISTKTTSARSATRSRANYRVEGDLRRDVQLNIKRLDRSRHVSRRASSPQSPGARPAHAHQRPHAQGTASHGDQEARRGTKK